jgi:adenylate kinase
MALNVIMLGPPGAGKGTQAERLAKERRLLKVSTGDILRDAVQSQTALGLKAASIIDAGKLVDDATMIAMVRERLVQADARCGFVLDGFPRTVAQAHALDEIMRDSDAGPLIVIAVMVPEAELVKRLSTRRICASCGVNADPFDGAAACKRCNGELVQRTDDNDEVVRKRLAVYERDTWPLLDYYRNRPTFRAVNGAQAPARVALELIAMVAAACSDHRRAGDVIGTARAAGRAADVTQDI